MLITVVKDPAAISSVERIEVEAGTNLLNWLINKYGQDGFSVPTRIFKGAITKSHELNLNSDLDCEIDANLFIVHQPLGVDPFSLFVLQVIAVAAFVQSLIPIPKLPTGERQDKKSPNNSLSGQTNIARPLERVPEIFGTDKSFPDLIAPTTFEFIDNSLFATEYMCVTRGYADLDEIKSGETLVEDIVGSSVQIYEPNESPTEVLKTTASNEVKTLTLNPPNDIGIATNSSFVVSYDSTTDTGFIRSPNGDEFSDYTIGSNATLLDIYINNGSTELTLDESYIVSGVSNHFVSISGDSVTYDSVNNRGTITGANHDELIVGSQVEINANVASGGDIDGIYVVYAKDSNSVTLSSVTSVNGNWASFISTTVDGSGNRAKSITLALGSASTKNINWTDPSLPKNLIEVLSITDSRILDGRIHLPDEAKLRGPFVVPDDENDEVWLDISFPRGLVIDSNKKYTVTVRFTFEEIDSNDDPLGPSFTVNYSFTNNVLEPLNFTRKVTSFDGLDITKRYRVTGERISDTNVGAVTLVDQCQWTRLAGIKDITNIDQTNTTRIQIKTQATEQTSSLQNREFNMIASRRVVTWDGSNVIGDIETGVGLSASSRMADIFLHYSLDEKLAARELSQINVDQIYDIQSELDLVFDGDLGKFNYTFDNQNTPALEELRQIANAARCFVFREGSILSLVRDEKQEISRGLFNRRNKIADRENKTVRFNKPLDNDGIQLEYADKDKKYKTQTIILPDDLPVDDPNYGLPNTLNPLKIELTGCKNRQQAWNRAQYELNRLIYQRVNVESEVTEEAVLLPLNARIDHVDGTTLARVQSNGEVLSFNDLTVETSERCFFEDGNTYSVILRNDLGEAEGPIIVEKRDDTEFGFILSEPPNYPLFVRGDNDYQVGTLYNFAPDGDELSNQYLVQRKAPNEQGNVTLELINYTDKYYQADDQTAPTI